MVRYVKTISIIKQCILLIWRFSYTIDSYCDHVYFILNQTSLNTSVCDGFQPCAQATELLARGSIPLRLRWSLPHQNAHDAAFNPASLPGPSSNLSEPLSPTDGLRIVDSTGMAASKSLSTLLAQASLDDHNEILQAANADIKKSKTNLDAHHARAVALLHLDRFDDAVKVFEEVKGLQEKARFEYAYALYKTGNAVQAVELAEAAGNKADRGMKHVLAQAV